MGMMKSKLRRLGWAFLALTFLLTGVVFGIYAFWQASRQEDKTQTSTQQPVSADALQGKPLKDFTPVVKTDSLQKIDKKTGDGKEAKAGSTVIVHYTGAVASTGIVFQSSYDSGQPIPIKLDKANVIAGWVDGVPGMKVGGERRLLIPAGMAFGENPNPSSGIPPNADLVFDIVLVDVQ